MMHSMMYDYSSTACSTGVFVVLDRGGVTVVQRPSSCFTSETATPEIAMRPDDFVPEPEDARPALPRYAAPVERRPWRGDVGRDRRDPRLLRHALTRWRRAV
jgi:hypothetical protein